MLNCSRMAGAATEILLRSMYVSRYMRLIKNRTIHRVFVGLRAASIEAASEVRTGGRLVSNNLSVTVTGARSEAINRRATMLGKFRFREPRFQSVRFSSRVRTKTRLKTEPTSKRHRAKSMPLTITRLRVRARPCCDRLRQPANRPVERRAEYRLADLPQRKHQPPDTPA